LWLHSYETTGTIIIKTNSTGNHVTLAGFHNSTSLTSQANGGLNVRVATGQYIATVSAQGSLSKRIVQIKPHQHLVYTMDLPPTIITEPVLPFGAYSIYVDSSHLLYVNMSDNLLYSITGGGAPIALSSTVTFSNVNWQSSSYGVGLSSDDESLWAITNGVVSQINLPFHTSTLYYSLPAAGDLVVSNSKSIYKQTAPGQFTKIYAADDDDTINSIAAGSSGLFVRFGQDTDDDATGDSDDSVGGSAIINYSGKTIATTSNAASAYTDSLSPNGQELAITNDSGTTIYNIHLQAIAKVPDGNVVGMTWLDDHTLLYGVGKNLFSYDINTSSTTQLSTVNGDSGVSGIYPTQDKSSLYILTEADGSDASTGDDDQNYEIVRIGLKGSFVPDYKYQLDAFFPAVLNDCGFLFINFTQPVITMTGPDYQTCLTAANTVIDQDELPSNAFTFSFSAATDD
jgi:hypothetical protein